MNIDTFWSTIDAARKKAASNREPIETCLVSSLRQLSKSEVSAFDDHATSLYHKAYDWNLWAGANVLMGGCGDDSFMDFRQALIGLGRERFERALEDPDSLADLNETDLDFLHTEMFLNFIDEVHGEDESATVREHPREPTGERWDEDGIQDRFPRLSARSRNESNKTEETGSAQDDTVEWPPGADEWAFKTCDGLLEEINSAISASKFNPEDLDMIFAAIDLILYISRAAMIYPWEEQKVGCWRSRILEVLDNPDDLPPYFQTNLADERARFVNLFQRLEDELCEEHI